MTGALRQECRILDGQKVTDKAKLLYKDRSERVSCASLRTLELTPVDLREPLAYFK